MPFYGIDYFEVDVLQEDIDKANCKVGDLQGNLTVSSLVKCLERLRDNLLLPGQEPGDYAVCNVIQVQPDINYSANVPVSTCSAYVCVANYATDRDTANNILLEFVAGIKPKPYKAKLTKY